MFMHKIIMGNNELESYSVAEREISNSEIFGSRK